MASIECDINGRRYVKVSGRLWRPEPSAIEPPHPHRNFGRGFQTRFLQGDNVMVRHHAKTCFAGVRKDTVSELWTCHGENPDEAPESSWRPPEGFDAMTLEFAPEEQARRPRASRPQVAAGRHLKQIRVGQIYQPADGALGRLIIVAVDVAHGTATVYDDTARDVRDLDFRFFTRGRYVLQFEQQHERGDGDVQGLVTLSAQQIRQLSDFTGGAEGDFVIGRHRDALIAWVDEYPSEACAELTDDGPMCLSSLPPGDGPSRG